MTAARFRCMCGVEVDREVDLPSAPRCPACGGALARVPVFEEAAPLSATLPAPDAPGPSRRSLIGRTIGPYQIVSELGRGTMGVVLEAVRPELDRRFALKVLLDATDEEAVLRFQREATVASRLQDPGVVGVYDVGVAEGHHYYAMDYIEGRSLRERLGRGGPLPPREAAALVCELARIMALAHSHDVTHRDLKPANVMLVPDEQGGERPRITDFGLARDHRDLMSSLSRTGDVFGTPLYMSPEQILGLRVDGKADIYALGVILYECLVDETPFYDADWIELARKIQDGDYRPASQINSAVPRALDAIIARAMALQPEDRYATATELEEALTRFLRTDPEPAPASRPSEWPLPGGGDSRLPLAIGLIAVTLAAVLTGLLVARRASVPPAAAAPSPTATASATPDDVAAPFTSAIADAERALAAGDLAAVRRAVEAAAAAAPPPLRLAEARRRLADAARAQATRAAARQTHPDELKHLALAVWILRDDIAGGSDLIGHIRRRALELRREVAPYEVVDAVLRVALDLRALPAERRLTQLSRARLAYARAQFRKVAAIEERLQEPNDVIAREARLVSVVSDFNGNLRGLEHTQPRLQELAQQSDRVGLVARGILDTNQRRWRALHRLLPLVLQAIRDHPEFEVGYISAGYLARGRLRRTERLALLRAAVTRYPDHWELQRLLGGALWTRSRTGAPHTDARRAYGRVVSLKRSAGAPLEPRTWLRATNRYLWTKQPAALLETCRLDAPRVQREQGANVPAATATYRSLAHFMNGDVPRAIEQCRRSLELDPTRAGMSVTLRSIPSELTRRFVAEVLRPAGAPR